MLDAAVTGLATRYDPPEISGYTALERILLRSSTTEDISETVKDYPELCGDSLSVQLAMVKQQQRKCESVQVFVDKINSLHPAARSLFSQVEQILNLLLTICCSNAEAEPVLELQKC